MTPARSEGLARPYQENAEYRFGMGLHICGVLGCKGDPGEGCVEVRFLVGGGEANDGR